MTEPCVFDADASKGKLTLCTLRATFVTLETVMASVKSSVRALAHDDVMYEVSQSGRVSPTLGFTARNREGRREAFRCDVDYGRNTACLQELFFKHVKFCCSP